MFKYFTNAPLFQMVEGCKMWGNAYQNGKQIYYEIIMKAKEGELQREILLVSMFYL